MEISINTHSSIRIKSDRVIYFDPYEIKDETHDARIVFITHNHYDHFDSESLKKVMNDETLIVIPDSMASDVLATPIKNDNIIGVEPGQHYDIDGLEVETIPAYNVNKKFHAKANNWVGYIVTIEQQRVYIAGDTDATEENKQVECDIALVPIGGTYTMDFKEASELINKIKPHVVIPIHYGNIVGDVQDGINFKKLLDKNIECQLLIK